MQRQVELIGAAWGLGGVDPGCADAPAVLAPLLLSRLREYGIPTLPGPILRPSPTERRKQVAVSRLCSLLASAVSDSPRHVCLVGVRSYEPEESERLARLGVRVYLMEEVRQRGLQRALDDALRIASQDTAGFGISIDLDVVTPEDAPGVAVPAEGGLGGAELALALEGIGGRPGLAAVELVEYCPRLDKGGRSARVAVNLLAAALCGSRDDAKVVADALDR